MLLELEKETLLTPYEEYIEKGGIFSEPDYQLCIDILSCPDNTEPNNRLAHMQITCIGSSCGIEVSDKEREIYSALRVEMPKQETHDIDAGTIHVWEMSDQFLAMHIFFVTDPTGQKHKSVYKRFFDRE